MITGLNYHFYFHAFLLTANCAQQGFRHESIRIVGDQVVNREWVEWVFVYMDNRFIWNFVTI